MTQQAPGPLPPNPFQLSPIKRTDNLAGRVQELKTIRYYLRLTASGQSPHIALIGQRGVGKTSLLNSSEQLAGELHLLPVRIDMNERKAQSPGRFWHDLYQNLILAMVKAGCWGGIKGAIYQDLLRMLYSRSPGNLDSAVIQMPYLFSCCTTSIDEIECPDSLVVNDFRACQSELETRELKGIALIVDEADCLGTNVPLLQMFRNIFQAVNSCSLILAGTEAVFPAISDVFSPIPRQFHRIDVLPFVQWPQTMDLIRRALEPSVYDSIGPNSVTVQELHELCGGAPDEVQLYCHHMYRTVEEGALDKMSLSPSVYRRVLREYRSNTPVNVEVALNAIERLPDKLLFESMWVSRRALTLDENVRLAVLRRGLFKGQALDETERTEFRDRIGAGYKTLFDAGIIVAPDRITLAGAPLTAGFWKSFVTVERNKRWSWNDKSLGSNVSDSIAQHIGKQCGCSWSFPLVGNSDALLALNSLRNGEKVSEFDEGMMEMITTAIVARDLKCTHAADVTFQLESLEGKHSQRVRYMEKAAQELTLESFALVIEQIRDLLQANGIALSVSTFERWKLPDTHELHRLALISGYKVPTFLGTSPVLQAFNKFEEGDIETSKVLFREVLELRESADIRNNLAFCQILTGELEEGRENATRARNDKYSPLYAMNHALAQFLQGDKNDAFENMREIWRRMCVSANESDAQASYVLILNGPANAVNSFPDIPVDAALLLNMVLSGAMDAEQAATDLSNRYPNLAPQWITQHLHHGSPQEQ
jgi:hypothetical protein